MRWLPWTFESTLSTPTENKSTTTESKNNDASPSQSSSAAYTSTRSSPMTPSPSDINIPASSKQHQHQHNHNHKGENPRQPSFPALSPTPSDSNPTTLVATLLLTSSILLAFKTHRRFLRRFPTATSICPSYLRSRSKSIFGYVTSVGDGDNFRVYHTPGGRLMGWSILPWKRVPVARRELRDQTIHIRLAGIDAPELAHFGRPEQPHAREAHAWLTSYLLNRRVRVYVYRQDQYQRVVGTVFVRRALDFPIPFRKRDVSLEMLKRGLATVYEAKTGAEFGGARVEKRYRDAEWWAKFRGRGMWRDFGKKGVEWESPREYKNRYFSYHEVGGIASGSGNRQEK